MKKYQIITFNKNCGTDEKMDYSTLKEAKQDIYKYNNHEYVYIVNNEKHTTVFTKHNKTKTNYNKLTKQQLIDLLEETQIKLEEAEGNFAYECECNKQLVEIQNKLENYENADRQDVLEEIKYREQMNDEKYNFTDEEIDRIVSLYKEYMGEDTTWNRLLNKAITQVWEEKSTTNYKYMEEE